MHIFARNKINRNNTVSSLISKPIHQLFTMHIFARNKLQNEAGHVPLVN